MFDTFVTLAIGLVIVAVGILLLVLAIFFWRYTLPIGALLFLMQGFPLTALLFGVFWLGGLVLSLHLEMKAVAYVQTVYLHLPRPLNEARRKASPTKRHPGRRLLTSARRKAWRKWSKRYTRKDGAQGREPGAEMES